MFNLDNIQFGEVKFDKLLSWINDENEKPETFIVQMGDEYREYRCVARFNLDGDQIT